MLENGMIDIVLLFLYLIKEEKKKLKKNLMNF